MKFPKNPQSDNFIDDSGNIQKALVAEFEGKDISRHERQLMERNNWSREDIIILRSLQQRLRGFGEDARAPDKPRTMDSIEHWRNSVYPTGAK